MAEGKAVGRLHPAAEWICGICYPKFVIGTYGQIILHGMHNHNLSFKQAKAKLKKKDEALREWQEKNRASKPPAADL